MSAFRTIWKFNVLGRDFGVAMPRGARVLAVQAQNDNAVMWALVDPNAEPIVREFRLVLTGGTADVDGWNYVGTFQQDWFVGHLFEKP